MDGQRWHVSQIERAVPCMAISRDNGIRNMKWIWWFYLAVRTEPLACLTVAPVVHQQLQVIRVLDHEEYISESPNKENANKGRDKFRVPSIESKGTRNQTSGRNERELGSPSKTAKLGLVRTLDQSAIYSRTDHIGDLSSAASSAPHPPSECLPAPVCPLFCGVIIDKHGCQQCACSNSASNRKKCKLSQDCKSPMQYCANSENICKCRPEYIAIRTSPLLCIQASEDPTPNPPSTTTPYKPLRLWYSTSPTVPSNVISSIESSVTITVDDLPVPKDFVEQIRRSNSEGKTTSAMDTHFHAGHPVHKDKLPAIKNADEIASHSTPQNRTIDPFLWWKALVVVSGSPMAPLMANGHPLKSAQKRSGDLASTCSQDIDCKSDLVCCLKSYCDGSNVCGKAKFCLKKCFI